MKRIWNGAKRIYDLLALFVGFVLLTEICIYLSGSLQARHFLNDPEFKAAARHCGQNAGYFLRRLSGKE